MLLYYTTDQLSEETGAPVEALLKMLDAGVFNTTVLLKRGRPMYSYRAPALVQRFLANATT